MLVATIIAKSNKRMNVRIEIVPLVITLKDFPEVSYGLVIGRFIAAPISIAGDTVAINIHIDEATSSALEIDNSIRLKMIATVAEVYEQLVQ